MPGWQRTRIEDAHFISPPPLPQAQGVYRNIQSFAAGAGSKITISFRPFPYSPIRVPWEAYIAEFTWNESFCDEQLRGPFAYWLHCHRVAAEERGGVAGTRVTDDVIYEMRFGGLGDIANTLLVRRQMKKMFEFRQKRLEYLLWQISNQLRPQG